MSAAPIDQALSAPPPWRGATAILVCESARLAEASAQRLAALGFGGIVAFGPGASSLQAAPDRILIDAPTAPAADRTAVLNRIIAWAAGRWTLLAFNGEFLFYPFCETRSVADFTDFLAWERRGSCMAYAIDLYADDLADEPELSSLHFDRAGWYGFEREDGCAEVYGGVGWRFEEFTPASLARVNRPALFRADPDRPIQDDLWFGDGDYDSLSCAWHNNPTCALMSVRRAFALASHPNFRAAAKRMIWPLSERFAWSSDQLVEHGLIEAGQWF